MPESTRQPLPFRWPGGKFYALKILRPFWLALDHDEYREPFAGGATIFFSKRKARFNWLNDIDQDLITTYRVMSDQKQRQQLVERLSKEIASRERWREMHSSTATNDFEVALRFYYLNRTSFSGKMVSAAWGYRPQRSLPPERWSERIIPCGEKLEGVKLTSWDFEKVIDAPSEGKKTLIYVDPPYYSPPRRKHYRNGFELQDHIRLRDALKRTNHFFFLTYDDVPEIRTLYSWANLAEARFFYRVDNSNVQHGSRRAGLELVISNFSFPAQLLLHSDSISA